VSSSGAASVTGPIIATSIDCNYPTLSGQEIYVLAHFSNPNLSTQLHVQSGKLTVLLDTGQGTTFQSRTFTGTGVTGFSAGTGVQINSTLTETASAASPGTTLGEITSIKGSIDCGNEKAGSTTIHLTGTSTLGSFDTDISSALVICRSYPASSGGNQIAVSGLAKAGTTPVSILVSIQNGTFSFEAVAGPANSVFLNGTGTATVSGDTAHVDGTASSTTNSSSVTVVGDATCGVHE
jgi:hypothetical protein